MVSFIDALFIMPIGLIAVAFIVPALVMSQQATANFKTATSIGMSDTVTQSFAMAFLEAEKDGRPNIESAAETMSGNNKQLNRQLLYDLNPLFIHFKVNFKSPFNDHDFCSSIVPDILTFKEGSDDRSCSFHYTIASGREFAQEMRYFRLTIPIRGGDTGVMEIEYQAW